MNINEIKLFYKQQAEFQKQIEIAKLNYSDFLSKTTRKCFHQNDETFNNSFEAQSDFVSFDNQTTYTEPEEWEILEYMVLPKISSTLDFLEEKKMLNRDDRIKIEFPNEFIEPLSQ